MVSGNVFKVRKVLMEHPVHSETNYKKYFPEPREIGNFSSWDHIFQPVLPQKSGSPIHLKLLFENIGR